MKHLTHLLEEPKKGKQLIWRLIIEDECVKLQCSQAGENDWWYVAAVTPDGRLRLHVSVPVSLGLHLVNKNTIKTFIDGK